MPKHPYFGCRSMRTLDAEACVLWMPAAAVPSPLPQLRRLPRRRYQASVTHLFFKQCSLLPACVLCMPKHAFLSIRSLNAACRIPFLFWLAICHLPFAICYSQLILNPLPNLKAKWESLVIPAQTAPILGLD